MSRYSHRRLHPCRRRQWCCGLPVVSGFFVLLFHSRCNGRCQPIHHDHGQRYPHAEGRHVRVLLRFARSGSDSNCPARSSRYEDRYFHLPLLRTNKNQVLGWFSWQRIQSLPCLQRSWNRVPAQQSSRQPSSDPPVRMMHGSEHHGYPYHHCRFAGSGVDWVSCCRA
ncbi:hypothetical protein SDC9_156001 [bioreactor metagenome]|uniref:Uncharacterized protein n=1 Tax=bioreactor metagenome TaxID=1076179 RepID=A0A645F522_9ZZZZ